MAKKQILINIRPCVLLTPHTLCEINNKEVRPNSALSAVDRLSHRGAPFCVMLQCFKRLQQLASCQRTLSALYSLCVTGQHVHDRFSIFTLRLCACEWMWAMVGSQLLLRARSPRSSLRLRSFDRDKGHSVIVLGGRRTYESDGGGFVIPAGPACRVWLSHRFHSLDEKAC